MQRVRDAGVHLVLKKHIVSKFTHLALNKYTKFMQKHSMNARHCEEMMMRAGTLSGRHGKVRASNAFALLARTSP